ncbi:hypothetical protein [Roseomonas sp. BN140053]|uniref:hypothetical protein n=1 Tax=Roseomonas sp. BN140053 TaxID=3391898 RepID=UPI0039E7F1B6
MPRLSCTLLLLLLAACRHDDFSRAGTWQPTGVNEINLQAMLSDPADANRGVAARDERGAAAAAPINRLLNDRRKPLPLSTWGSATGAAPSAGADAR